MAEVNLKCKNCGAEMQVDLEKKTITCIHCGDVHLLSEILDEDELEKLNKLSPKDLENKFNFKDCIKQGETYLFRAEFDKAEEAFKLAISFDDTDYRGYLGVVKAKTNNFSVLPHTDDYKEYAKSAEKLAKTDDKVYVKNELEKLDMLKDERKKLELEQKSREEKLKQTEMRKRKQANFFSKLAYFITGLIAVAVLFGLVVSIIIKDKDKQPSPATIEISSAKEFSDALSNSKNFKSTIILKNDIDFENMVISPLGKDSSFSGSIHGGGHIVKNLIIRKTETDESTYAGLFEKIDGGKITGIKFDNVKLELIISDSSSASNLSSAGIIAGYIKNAEISNCEILNNCSIKISETNTEIFAGGIAGLAESSTFRQSYSNAAIEVLESSNQKQEHLVGGLVGYLNDSQITKCYTTSKIKVQISSSSQAAKLSVGGIAGKSRFLSEKAKILNSFFAGQIENSSNLMSVNFASISNFDETVNSNRVYSNLALLENDNFSSLGVSLEISDLTDADSPVGVANKEYVEIVTSSETFLIKIKNLFGETIWENFDTLSPNLKPNKTESTTESGASFF